MITAIRCQLVLLGMLPFFAMGRAGEKAPLNEAEFTKLHTLVKPRPEEEKWLQIPWSVNLWEARKRAAAEGKPILLWEMDGHPLGCT